jgi:hypothetical protein
MYLAYFDENKYSDESPYFYIGGILVQDSKVVTFEKIVTQIQYNFFGTSVLSKETEMHGLELWHGKGPFKKRKLQDRIGLLKNIETFLITNRIPIRMICIDVNAHRGKYRYPEPEYQLGLMLILERFRDFLDKNNDIGIVFGDYEKDEITKAVLDFSQFKFAGKTPMYFGRPLGRLVDTIYFTHSHHSRFLQIADVVVYLANRFEKITVEPTTWHEKEGYGIWKDIKQSTDFSIQSLWNDRL